MEMDMKMFVGKMKALLPGADLAFVRALACHALEAEREGEYSREGYFKEAYVEFMLIKRHHGAETACRLLDVCGAFSLYPHELRGAANHLRRGVEPERVGALALDGKCERTQEELLEFEDALEAFKNRLWRSAAKKGGCRAHCD